VTDSIIQGVTDYFMACPLLKDGAFRVNSLGDTPIEYAIETGIGNPILRTYLDGSSVRQYKFNFSSREYFSLDRAERKTLWQMTNKKYSMPSVKNLHVSFQTFFRMRNLTKPTFLCVCFGFLL
jgi:hypothetical protein